MWKGSPHYYLAFIIRNYLDFVYFGKYKNLILNYLEYKFSMLIDENS